MDHEEKAVLRIPPVVDRRHGPKMGSSCGGISWQSHRVRERYDFLRSK